MKGNSIRGKVHLRHTRIHLFFFVLLNFVPGLNGKAQTSLSEPVAVLLVRLDSVRKSPSVSRYFAEIYFETTVNAIQFFSRSDQKVKELIDRMQLRFADYFFYSAHAFREGREIPAPWKAYYSDSSASALRCMLYGINAHINGDIWQAITAEFSADEIKSLKPHYLAYRKGLLEIYRQLYKQAIETHSLIGLVHRSSFGLDKLYGKIMLKRWRKRQLRLSELYYLNRDLFEKEQRKLAMKMEQVNRLIRKNI